MFFDPLYIKLALPGLLLALLATWLTRSTFAKYARIRSASGLTGAEAAERLLASQGITGVTVREHQGFLSDHYDPRNLTLNLSPDVYRSVSLSAIGVACHEAGHAIQHAKLYAPLKLRTELVPVTNFGSQFAYILFFAGMIMHSPIMLKVGVVLFLLTVVFAFITLPVEWDASRRAKQLMVSAGIVTPLEQASAARVLNAAFLTYVAGAVTALLTLLYYLIRSGLLGGRRD
ncbi:MAG: zinc metallopeptidase [Kiritimatiellaeota bacterium]|nr:zinc metallopeptidase [Kiritimatiellota bacterium]